MSETLRYSVTATELLNEDNTIVFEFSVADDSAIDRSVSDAVIDGCIAHFGESLYQVTRVCRVGDNDTLFEIYSSPLV